MKTLRLTTLMIGCLLNVIWASPMTLTQAGWSEDGPLTITFSGLDTDLSGTTEDFELTELNASFKLPSGEAAVLGIGDLASDSFFFESATNYFVKADSAFYSLYEIGDSDAPVALFSDASGSFVAFSGDPLTAVPEPETLVLLGGSLIAFAALARTKTFRG